MHKIVTLFILLVLSLGVANARTSKKNKKKKTQGMYRPSKHARRSKRFHHGTGPDLKAITTESPYQEDPSNGVNPVETKEIDHQ